MSHVRKVPKKCHVLFEWPLKTARVAVKYLENQVRVPRTKKGWETPI